MTLKEKLETLVADEISNMMWILYEEWEGTEGVREFQTISVSNDIEQLRKEMQEIVEDDEYELFIDNGIGTQSINHTESNFLEQGFVGYYITPVKRI